MKTIKITGKNTGLARELISVLSTRGHLVTGYARGELDLQDIEAVVKQVRDADVFINNAGQDFCQAEILDLLFREWQHDASKLIVNISSRAAHPNISQGYLYAAQKAALDHLASNLVFNSDKACRITTVNLGLMGDRYPGIDGLTYQEAADIIAGVVEIDDHIEIPSITVQHRTSYQQVQQQKTHLIDKRKDN